MTLSVSELFGPTIQGEGPAAGQLATFVRFMGCNLSCSWCDTPYTWDGGRFDLRGGTEHHTPQAVARWVDQHPGIVVLTGGEPLLQQHRPAWAELLGLLAHRELHVETNGTLLPEGATLEHLTTIVVSPKLPNAGSHRGHQDPAIADGYGDLACHHTGLHLKVVCADRADVLHAAVFADSLGWPRERVWVMPLGATAVELAHRWPEVAAAAADYELNATHRLHVLAWGDERGR